MTVSTQLNILKNYIGGQWIESSSGQQEAVVNPATEEVLAYVPLSNRADLDQAVAAAKEAFQTWGKIPVPRRARALFKYQQLLHDHWEELARLITVEKEKVMRKLTGKCCVASSLSSLPPARLI